MSFDYELVEPTDKILFGILRFLLKFTGKDEEINLLGDGTEKPEFGEWSWVSPDQLIELVSIIIYLYCDELQH